MYAGLDLGRGTGRGPAVVFWLFMKETQSPGAQRMDLKKGLVLHTMTFHSTKRNTPNHGGLLPQSPKAQDLGSPLSGSKGSNSCGQPQGGDGGVGLGEQSLHSFAYKLRNLVPKDC